MKTTIKLSVCILLTIVLSMNCLTVMAEENKETVYVLTDAEGETQQVFVSRSEDGISTEAVRQDADARQLPVKVSFRYELDGKQVKPDELAGKTGHLEIFIDYGSLIAGNAEVKGETVEMPVPFIAVTVLPINEDVFTNVKVTNGRVIKLGRVSVTACFGLPGLGSIMDIDGSGDISVDLDIPTGAVISADVRDFASEGAYTIVTGMNANITDVKLPVGIKFKGFKVNTDFAANLLMGSVNKTLTDVSELAVGTSGLSNDMNALKTNAEELTGELSDAKAKGTVLTDGADQITDMVLGAVNGRVAAYADMLSALGIKLSRITLDNYAAEAERIKTELAASAAAAQDGTVNANGSITEVCELLESVTSDLDSLKAFRSDLDSYTSAVDKAGQTAGTISNDAGELEKSAKSMSAKAVSLNDAVDMVKRFYDGDIKELIERVNALKCVSYGGYSGDDVNTTMFIIRTSGI
jgi:putative membrane protein